MLENYEHKMKRGGNPRTITKNIDMLVRNGINVELARIASRLFAEKWIKKS